MTKEKEEIIITIHQVHEMAQQAHKLYGTDMPKKYVLRDADDKVFAVGEVIAASGVDTEIRILSDDEVLTLITKGEI